MITLQQLENHITDKRKANKESTFKKSRLYTKKKKISKKNWTYLGYIHMDKYIQKDPLAAFGCKRYQLKKMFLLLTS